MKQVFKYISLFILILFISFGLTSQLKAQTTFVLSPSKCNYFPTNTLCGNSVELDSNDQAVGQVAISFLPNGVVMLIQYDANGQHAEYHPVTTTSVTTTSFSGTFDGGSVSVNFFVVTTIFKGHPRSTTYMSGVVTAD